MPSTTPRAIEITCCPFGPAGSPKRSGSRHPDDVGAHAVHVAHDAADAGRRPLDGEHLRRMVVALVADDEAPRVAVLGRGEADDPRILPRAEHDVRRLRREELLEHAAAALVAAVLAPHRVEDRELHDGRIAPEKLRRRGAPPPS